MPVPSDPYTFADGPGNTASGLQVNERFDQLYEALDGALDETNLAVPKGIVAAHRSTDMVRVNGEQIVFNAETFDVSGWYDTTTGLYTPLVAGYYRISWNVRSRDLPASDAIFWESQLAKNGAAVARGSSAVGNGFATLSSPGSALVVANGTTDYFSVAIFHNDGGGMNIATGAHLTYFHAELVGRAS